MLFIVTATVVAAFAANCEAGPAYIGGRIVNGTDADIQDYPYMVSLQFNGRHTCGGSIIDEFNILTAAHCVTRDVRNFTVLYGSTDLDSGSDAIPLERIIIHEGYTGLMPLYHDIAVLHLVRPIPFNRKSIPIRLPSQFAATPENAPAVLTGWGLEATGGTAQNTLQKVDIQVFTEEECEVRHALSGPTSRVWNVCAGIPEGGKGQCNGDSGGPLVVDGVEVGIVSWSVKPCTVVGYPGVFVRVSSYINWIFDHLRRF